jgi:hypothetical protein
MTTPHIASHKLQVRKCFWVIVFFFVAFLIVGLSFRAFSIVGQGLRALPLSGGAPCLYRASLRVAKISLVMK